MGHRGCKAHVVADRVAHHITAQELVCMPVHTGSPLSMTRRIFCCTPSGEPTCPRAESPLWASTLALFAICKTRPERSVLHAVWRPFRDQVDGSYYIVVPPRCCSFVSDIASVEYTLCVKLRFGWGRSVTHAVPLQVYHWLATTALYAPTFPHAYQCQPSSSFDFIQRLPVSLNSTALPWFAHCAPRKCHIHRPSALMCP